MGWSQSELAALAGVSEPSISRLERYEGTGRLSTLQKIEVALLGAGITLVQEQDGFGLKITGAIAEDLRSKIRNQQTGRASEKGVAPSNARVRKRVLKLDGPPTVPASAAKRRRKLKVDE